MSERPNDAIRPSQSRTYAGSEESQIAICWGEPSLTNTADRAPADSPGTVVFSTVPPYTQRSPFLAAHPSRTVWVPLTNVVTAVPETLAPLATASISVVAGAPSPRQLTVPPNDPAWRLATGVLLGVGVGAKVGVAVGG